MLLYTVSAHYWLDKVRGSHRCGQTPTSWQLEDSQCCWWQNIKGKRLLLSSSFFFLLSFFQSLCICWFVYLFYNNSSFSSIRSISSPAFLPYSILYPSKTPPWLLFRCGVYSRESGCSHSSHTLMGWHVYSSMTRSSCLVHMTRVSNCGTSQYVDCVVWFKLATVHMVSDITFHPLKWKFMYAGWFSGLCMCSEHVECLF